MTRPRLADRPVVLGRRRSGAAVRARVRAAFALALPLVVIVVGGLRASPRRSGTGPRSSRGGRCSRLVARAAGARRGAAVADHGVRPAGADPVPALAAGVTDSWQLTLQSTWPARSDPELLLFVPLAALAAAVLGVELLDRLRRPLVALLPGLAVLGLSQAYVALYRLHRDGRGVRVRGVAAVLLMSTRELPPGVRGRARRAARWSRPLLVAPTLVLGVAGALLGTAADPLERPAYSLRDKQLAPLPPAAGGEPARRGGRAGCSTPGRSGVHLHERRPRRPVAAGRARHLQRRDLDARRPATVGWARTWRRPRRVTAPKDRRSASVEFLDEDAQWVPSQATAGLGDRPRAAGRRGLRDAGRARPPRSGELRPELVGVRRRATPVRRGHRLDRTHRRRRGHPAGDQRTGRSGGRQHAPVVPDGPGVGGLPPQELQGGDRREPADGQRLAAAHEVPDGVQARHERTVRRRLRGARAEPVASRPGWPWVFVEPGAPAPTWWSATRTYWPGPRWRWPASAGWHWTRRSRRRAPAPRRRAWRRARPEPARHCPNRRRSRNPNSPRPTRTTTPRTSSQGITIPWLTLGIVVAAGALIWLVGVPLTAAIRRWRRRRRPGAGAVVGAWHEARDRLRAYGVPFTTGMTVRDLAGAVPDPPVVAGLHALANHVDTALWSTTGPNQSTVDDAWSAVRAVRRGMAARPLTVRLRAALNVRALRSPK